MSMFYSTHGDRNPHAQLVTYFLRLCQRVFLSRFLCLCLAIFFFRHFLTEPMQIPPFWQFLLMLVLQHYW